MKINRHTSSLAVYCYIMGFNAEVEVCEAFNRNTKTPRVCLPGTGDRGEVGGTGSGRGSAAIGDAGKYNKVLKFI